MRQKILRGEDGGRDGCLEMTLHVRVGMGGGMAASCGSGDCSLCEGENGGKDGYLV